MEVYVFIWHSDTMYSYLYHMFNLIIILWPLVLLFWNDAVLFHPKKTQLSHHPLWRAPGWRTSAVSWKIQVTSNEVEQTKVWDPGWGRPVPQGLMNHWFPFIRPAEWNPYISGVGGKR